MNTRRVVRWAIGGVVLGVIALQFVPGIAPRRNPGITAEPILDRDARVIAERACFDCHSNRTVWPWYSAVAPARWLVVRDVVAARDALNFSEFDRPQRRALDASEIVRTGEMPPARYTALHAVARLTPAERETLARGLDVLRDGNDETRSTGSGGIGFSD